MSEPERVVAVGCDLQGIRAVAASLTAFGDSYLRRVLHPEELAACAALGDPHALARRVAQHFAAKEAVAKTLGMRAELPLPWTDIEIVLDDAGVGRALLHGAARELGARRAIDFVRVTVSSAGAELALAVAIAVSRTPQRGVGHIS